MRNHTEHNYNSQILVDMWSDFIDWKKRRQGENHWLLKTLRSHNCQNIFDACLGDGADSIYLLKNKLQVISNELDPEFQKKAQANAKQNNVELKLKTYDWRELDQHLPANYFDAITCLGNSFTYLFKKKDREKTLQNFLHILKKGGILLIDERNYQKILDQKDIILKTGTFPYSKKYVYCGDNVKSTPIQISNKKITFQYIHKKTGRQGVLFFYPFKKGELLDCLQKAGFKKIQQYSDYQRKYSDNADFYQYLCQK
ncbi:MAG TPA: class I SAM-dependent methyltransferase [bacterium]|nr:class I SAM-dependent methyltransferase [bacterium]